MFAKKENAAIDDIMQKSFIVIRIGCGILEIVFHNFRTIEKMATIHVEMNRENNHAHWELIVQAQIKFFYQI